MVYSDSNSVVADHTRLGGGQAQGDDPLLEEEPHQDECLLPQGTGGVDLQSDGEGLGIWGGSFSKFGAVGYIKVHCVCFRLIFELVFFRKEKKKNS